MPGRDSLAAEALNVKAEYLKIVDRLLLSLPFQVIVFVISVLRVLAFRRDGVIQFAFACMVLNGFYRFGLYVLKSRLANKNHSTMLGLILPTIVVGSGVWGFTAAHTIAHYGLTVDAMIVLLSALGTAAAVTGVSFSCSLSLAAHLLILGPPAVVFLAHPEPHFHLFALLELIYAAYLCTLAYSFRRAQVQVIASVATLEQKEHALEAALTESRARQDEVVTMLASIDQAYLIFDRDGLCGNDPSRKSEELLGLDPACRSLEEVLRGTHFSDHELRSWFEALFADELPFIDVAAHGPRTMRVERTGRFLHLDYHPMRDQAKRLKAVVITATDVTLATEAEMQLAEERERAAMILRVNERRSNFRPFLNELELLLHQMMAWEGEELAPLRESLHRAQVGASAFGLESIVRWLTQAERALALDTGADRFSVVRAQGEALGQRFRAWKNREMGLLTQVGVFDEDSIEISRRKLARIGERFANDEEKLKFFRALSAEIRSDELGNILKSFEIHVSSFAAQRGKQVMFRVVPLAEAVYLPVGAYREAFRSLIHLFSYSIGEAIESVEERRLKGKPEAATIEVHYGKRGDESASWIRILISDDGRGFDLERLRFSLRAKGRSGLENLSDNEVASLLFDASDLAVVKKSILKSNGRLNIVSTDTRGTTVEVLLPEVNENAATSPIL